MTFTDCIAKNRIQIPFHSAEHTGKYSPLIPNLPTTHKGTIQTDASPTHLSEKPKKENTTQINQTAIVSSLPRTVAATQPMSITAIRNNLR